MKGFLTKPANSPVKFLNLHLTLDPAWAGWQASDALLDKRDQ